MMHRAAVRFYAEAFTAQPKLAENAQSVHRYNAACAAALSGCGVGEDAEKLDDQERTRLRRQALDWLRADLEAWGRFLDKEADNAQSKANVIRMLQHWLMDPDFAGVRGPEALARLPEAERQTWHKLWGDVRNLLTQAQDPAAQRLPSPPAAPVVLDNKGQRAFEVTAVSLRADPANYSGPAPGRIQFRGEITANGPGTVRYTFLRSDRARGPVSTLTFEKAGVKEVSTDWLLSGKHEGWQALQVLAPNEVISEKAGFKVECSR
jgi:hypothetical protein